MDNPPTSFPGRDEDRTSPWYPYRWALGVQASLLTHPRFAEGVPADVERESEAMVRFLRESCATLLNGNRRADGLKARTAGGHWTDENRAELRRLVAWNTEHMAQIEARRQRYLAMLARHDLPHPHEDSGHWQRGKVFEGKNPAKKAVSPRTGQQWL